MCNSKKVDLYVMSNLCFVESSLCFHIISEKNTTKQKAGKRKSAIYWQLRTMAITNHLVSGFDCIKAARHEAFFFRLFQNEFINCVFCLSKAIPLFLFLSNPLISLISINIYFYHYQYNSVSILVRLIIRITRNHSV